MTTRYLYQTDKETEHRLKARLPLPGAGQRLVVEGVIYVYFSGTWCEARAERHARKPPLSTVQA